MVRAALLSVTASQFTQLAWSELSYRLGGLRTRFEVELGDADFEQVWVFVSRFGAFAVDGRPVALAAVPADGRTAKALTQEELLDAVASLAIGPGSTAADFVSALHLNFGAAALRIAATLWPEAIPFESELWQPFEP
jgi:hypothetical protein